MTSPSAALAAVAWGAREWAEEEARCSCMARWGRRRREGGRGLLLATFPLVAVLVAVVAVVAVVLSVVLWGEEEKARKG